MIELKKGGGEGLRLEHDEDGRVAFRFALQVVAQRARFVGLDGLRCLLEELLDLGGGY